MRIGVLALQGAFIEHEILLKSLGADCIELREKRDIDRIDGLVLPGGESTVQAKLLHELGMFEVLQEKIRLGLPTLATCAGLILLARHITNDAATHLATLPVTVRRNAYGRQLGSFTETVPFEGLGPFTMTFIRAPSIESTDKAVKTLASFKGKPVAVRYENQIALAFHPELGKDRRIHAQFLELVKRREG